MRTVPSGLATELTGRTQALVRIVSITRKNGTVVRFAETQDDITVAGQTYTVARGIRMSSIPFSLNGRQSTVDFEVTAVDNGLIDPDDLRNGLYDTATVVISACSQLNPANGKVDLFRGQMGEIEITDRGMAKIQVLGLLSKARRIPIEHYTPTCRTNFGDERCKVDLGPLTVSTTITNVSGFDVTVAATPAAHFRLGLLSPTSGPGVGEGFEIRAVSGSVLSLYLPPGGKLVAGNTVDLTPGCDFTRDGAQGCKFWNNIINFRGEPDVPGADVLSITFQDWGA